tara:strand:+ start:1396 stop:2328 length:933 start_codon:yes stop_codon:yes gene_type:complete
VGLDQDVDILRDVLSCAGHDVTVSHCREINPFDRWLISKPRFDANIFLERIFPRWFGSARINMLIPNQERYPKRHIARLKKIEHVLCKSRHAESIFNAFQKSNYIGFTSTDRSLPDIAANYEKFFHLAGRSTLKGTDALLSVWKRHPEWPTLTLLQCRENAPKNIPKNVNHIADYVSNEQLQQLLNEHGVHLCPSLSEGWGHYIVEAMSCSALTLTTDAPPMNELVIHGRGYTVPYDSSEARHLGTNFHVSEDQLEASIEEIIGLPTEAKQTIGKASRAWFESNNSTFRTHLPEVIDQLMNHASPRSNEI